ncbi:MAG: phosphoserine phosphatase RsbU/P [Candidatus Poribacteria bacterium]|nr:phosphoserine phosphatase RsbU/P [Candidatus Poribacteria bacterium]
MTLSRKIIIGYSIVIFSMIVILIWSFVSLLGLGRGILKNNYISILAADNMSTAIERQNDAIFLIILGFFNEGSKQFKDNEKQFLQWFETEKDYITEEGESQVVKDIDTKYSLYLAQFSMLKNIYHIDRQKSIRFYYNTMLPSCQSVSNSCDNLREINQNSLIKIINRARFITTRSVWFMIVICIVAIGMGLGISLILSDLIAKQRIKLFRNRHELFAAAKIQAHLIPQRFPKILQSTKYKIAARNIPSEVVSGDFYDFIPFPDLHLGMVIADVSGKGMPASILMASARASLRAYLEDPHTVGETITRLNRVLYRDISDEQFITLFYGTLDIQSGTLIYTNAGHNPPILFRNSEMKLLDKGGLILGILPDAKYEEEEIQLMEGDLLLFYTDGITETERRGEYFGVERLSAIVQNNRFRNLEEILEKILNEVAKFNGGGSQADDITIMLLSYSNNLD